MKPYGADFPTNLDMEVRLVQRPQTWREQPYQLSYLLVKRELNPRELILILRWAALNHLENPRVIPPELMSWSSLLHPRFFASLQADMPTSTPLFWTDNQLPGDFFNLSRLWLQSMMFLAGVTLSAAVIQTRFSFGTIASKLDRLWDAGTLADNGLAAELKPLQLHELVLQLAKGDLAKLDTLLTIRQTFMDLLKLIAPDAGKRIQIRPTPLPAAIANRFGFIEQLRQTLGQQLQAVIIYGSSISSKHYADIDALLVVSEPQTVLRQLAGTSPCWQGKELNIGVYSPDELLTMQELSGDNLAGYGVCIWGEAQVVDKPVNQLLARNFSFAAIRQRQQLGMLSRQVCTPDLNEQDRYNLNQYFVKIPANVAKGTIGAVGERLSKEAIHHWLLTSINFDVVAAQQQAQDGQVVEALASSALASGKVLTALNDKFSVASKINVNNRANRKSNEASNEHSKQHK